MTPLEILKQIRRFDGNLSREQNQRYYELEQNITQQEQFAKDVARYFELEQQFYDGFSDDVDVETLDEMNKESEALKEKLSKVGKEE